MSTNANIEPFRVKDCALVTIATGKKAQNLKEMREHLLNVHLGSVYHHFWGGLLRPRFDEPEYNNDFAEWVHYALQDNILAERLSVINPDPFVNLESLRQELINIIEQRLDETETIPWAKPDHAISFSPLSNGGFRYSGRNSKDGGIGGGFTQNVRGKHILSFY